MVVKKWTSNRWFVFSLVFAWKTALLLFSAQPVPANDSFFYDGPVVNYLLHGAYVNPSLALAFPLSGTQFFSAYPPLYQLLLLPWMFVFGTSALAAMWLHLVLFGSYLLILLAIFKRLHTPVWCVHVAAGFLLVLTFNDRPDSLAHVFGMLAVYSWIRTCRFYAQNGTATSSRGWRLAAASFVILCFGTSLQIGAIYFLWVFFGMLTTTLARKEKCPWLPMTLMVVIPITLVVLVAAVFPHLWAGFLEHARQTPSLTGWRVPTIADILKVVRTAPGVIAVGVLLPWLWFKQHKGFESPVEVAHETVAVTGLLMTLAVIVACLFLLTPNLVAIAVYFQPLLAAGYLTLLSSLVRGPRLVRIQTRLFVLLIVLGSLRAVGMSTWGLACAADVSYAAAIQRIDKQLDEVTGKPKPSVVLSAAYLYTASSHTNIQCIHSDWLAPAKSDGSASDFDGLIALKPAKLVLTQFDYYRRYATVIEQLKSRPGLVEVQLSNTANTPPPDSIRLLQRVVQHISWAPVIINLSWKDKP